MVDELRVHDDLVDLPFGAVTAHVGFLEHVVKLGVRVHAMDDVLEYLFLALCAGTVPILLADGIATMALSVAIAGVGIAPALIASSTLVEELLPRAALVEGLTWVVTALTVGAAAGAALAGVAIDLAGSRAAFAAALAAGLVSVLVAVLGRGSLRPKWP